MLVILEPNTEAASPAFQYTWNYLSNLPNIEVRKHLVTGEMQTLTELYLIGDTKRLNIRDIQVLPGVERAIRITEPYRILGRHRDDHRATGFDYQGLHFDQDSFHVFAGLCAVDTPAHVEEMLQALKANGLTCTRMGAYKPRTSPYSFQGHGKDCLPFVFELAGKYGIQIISMEVTHERHIDEIKEALHAAGNPTGVMFQIGTRNTQNFELLKAVGRQQEHPVLFKRGYGVTLTDSLNAAEYLASEGNSNVIFCLRGMKTSFSAPHRNLVDFAHVPAIKRQTRMPVCIDPTHSVGSRDRSPDGLLDLFHATAQGIIAGANMVLVEFHPCPSKALCDGPQALLLEEMEHYLEDIHLARQTYLQRRQLREKYDTALLT